jgi:hypothetical protein
LAGFNFFTQEGDRRRIFCGNFIFSLSYGLVQVVEESPEKPDGDAGFFNQR